MKIKCDRETLIIPGNWRKHLYVVINRGVIINAKKDRSTELCYYFTVVNQKTHKYVHHLQPLEPTLKPDFSWSSLQEMLLKKLKKHKSR